MQYSPPFGGDDSYANQVMLLRKRRLYREFPLNLAVYRVKTPGFSFLYCTPADLARPDRFTQKVIRQRYAMADPP